MYIIDIYLSPVSPSTYTIYIYLQEHLLSPETAAPTRLRESDSPYCSRPSRSRLTFSPTLLSATAQRPR